MKKDIIQIIKVTTIALALTLGVNYVMAWTGPTQAPPDGNVSAPVNIGAVSQIKNGGLGLNALSVFGNSFFQGTLGIGDTTPDGGLKLDVNGNIGANSYCDSNGSNCIAATSLGGGAGGGITGSGTTNYIPKWTSGTALGDSGIRVYGDRVGLGVNPQDFEYSGYKLTVDGAIWAKTWLNVGSGGISTTGTINAGSVYSKDKLTVGDFGGLIPVTQFSVKGDGGVGGKFGVGTDLRVGGASGGASVPVGVPNGWSGIVTRDMHATGSVRAYQICLGGTLGGTDMGTCKTSWPAAGASCGVSTVNIGSCRAGNFATYFKICKLQVCNSCGCGVWSGEIATPAPGY